MAPWVRKVPWRKARQPTLAWRIPRIEDPGRLQSIELQRVRHDGATNTFTCTLEIKRSQRGIWLLQKDTVVG